MRRSGINGSSFPGSLPEDVRWCFKEKELQGSAGLFEGRTMKNIRIVQQKKWHCFPACLESIFFDDDIGIKKDQEKIVKDNPDIFREGVLIVQDPGELARVFERYGIQVSVVYQNQNKRYDPADLQKIAADANNKIFLLWRIKDRHCVRFVDFGQSGDIAVMDPQTGIIEIYDAKKQDELNLGILYFTKKGGVR